MWCHCQSICQINMKWKRALSSVKSSCEWQAWIPNFTWRTSDRDSLWVDAVSSESDDCSSARLRCALQPHKHTQKHKHKLSGKILAYLSWFWHQNYTDSGRSIQGILSNPLIRFPLSLTHKFKRNSTSIFRDSLTISSPQNLLYSSTSGLL